MKKSMIMVFLFIAILSIPQIVLAASELEVTFETNITEATPGTQGYVTLNLQSIGSSNVEGIQVEATSADYWEIKPLGDWEIQLGDLSSGHSTSTVFNYELSSSASPGLYEIKFKIKTTNAGYITRYAVVKIEEPNVLDIVSVRPSSIDIGKTTTLLFNISNNGGSTIGDILFTWEDTNDLILPIGSDNRITVSSIPAGNYTEIPINIMASPSANPAVYPLTITMEFYDTTGTKQTIISEVGMQVGGATDFDVITQSSTGSTTSFAVANIGSNAASSVIVTIPNQLSYQVNGVSSVSLGNLDAGDYTLATFQISYTDKEDYTQWPDKSSKEKSSDFNYSKLKNLKSGTDDLIVEVSYTDLFGVRHTVQKEVEVTSSFDSYSDKSSYGGKDGDLSSYDKSPGLDLDNGTIYIIIGVAGIIVIIAILQFSKRKKK